MYVEHIKFYYVILVTRFDLYEVIIRLSICIISLRGVLMT